MPAPHSSSAAATAEMIAALRPHAPFAAMEERDLARLARAARLVYFPPGDVVLPPGRTRPEHCYVVKQGTVRGEQPGADGPDTALFTLSAGEMFPLGALVGERAPTSTYRAAQDTFCLVFPTTEFDALMASSPVFRDFCTRRLAYLLDAVRASVQAEYVGSVTTRHDLATPLRALVRGAPVTVTADAAIGDALALMDARHIGSVPVVDALDRPLGIFTRHDVIGRVVLPQVSLRTAIADVMSAPAQTLALDANAADAALAMAQGGLRHLVLTGADGRVGGVVSERDLFQLHRLSAREMSQAVRRANDLPSLVQCAADIRALSHALVAQGVGSGPLMKMISALNDRLTARVIDLVQPEYDLSGVAWCWLGLGSEGRAEQTIPTDQDNALLFVANDPDAPEARLRESLVPFAHAVNQALGRCGFPLCADDTMAGNARWCLSLPEWQSQFAHWIAHGNAAAVRDCAIFFDFRAVAGSAEHAQTLRQEVAEVARVTPAFRKRLADDARRNRPPLSWTGHIAETTDAAGAEGIDVKLYGTQPMTDAARVMALAAGVTATGTVERLRGAARVDGVRESDVATWCDTFEYLQMLRLRTQHRRLAHELPPAANPNLVPVARLSALDRRVLKESLRQVGKLQQRLALDYP
ncbi:MAG: DUF294 nucleotidyltransferase-like domain-containing protein [Burkholderiales bacterium]